MMLPIPDLLDADALARVRALLAEAAWIDGNATSGAQSALSKRNRQLPENSAAAREAGGIVLAALGNTPLFVAAALPLKVFPPLFNRYEGGEAFGAHVDNAIRMQRGTDFRIRSDLSCTIFLSDPADYDGGELVVEGSDGERRVKLGAGSAILYPASSVHRVEPVTRGVRLASFFWLQSMVRSAEDRAILFDLDRAVQRVGGELGQGSRAAVELTGVYHNLLRRWADA
ncbi:Fe2+-dependent dioxygenase [Sphingomonas donggukensis]|uniref:Fe2+-dependent dioxygenase n=1 Tax=Sphingomonas donggukensis TaxID=2949093 RepID=A0ABY4TS35_9SPHN|nr:Fe2+-dependent dioxygenase [Sphingomonas donggukensis]URW75123.1 Fe2+-dependent dioxygenase [Sphingomonas donggukensis]